MSVITNSVDMNLRTDLQSSHLSSGSRKVIIVAGSNRTGTSMLSDILIKKGFRPPADLHGENLQYETYESRRFKEISRKWNWKAASEFVNSLTGDNILLKYPKASYVLGRWLKLLPEARVIYVYRPREEAVEKQLQNWWKGRPLAWIVRWIYRYQWTKGLLAMSNLSVPVCFVTFDELRRTESFEFPASFAWDE